MSNNVMNMDGSFKPFRAWCQHVLPLVYDDSLSYMELLNKVIVYINSFGEYLEDFSVINEVTYGGIWDITKQYKIWTVVSDGDTGYMSVQNVPAGIPISNHDYWLKVADFAGQLVDLGERVIALESKMTQAEGNINELSTRMSTAEGNINNLTPRVTSLETNVSNLTPRVSNAEDDIDYLETQVNTDWSNRKIIYVGDSYGRGLSVVGGSTYYGNSWCYYVDQKLHPSASYNMSVNQAAFFANENESLRYGYQLKTFKDNHTQDECEAITDIIICGGFNEIYNADYDRVNSNADYCAKWTNNYIHTNFPNARVFLGFIGRVPKISGVAQATFGNFQKGVQSYKDICSKYGWKYIDKSEYMSHDYTKLSDDGVHFKPTGYEYIGNALAECLNNGYWNVSMFYGLGLSWAPYTDSENHVVATAVDGVYDGCSDEGIMIFLTADGAFRTMFSSKTIDLSTWTYLFKYQDVTTQTFNRFTPLFDTRLTGYALIFNGSNIVRRLAANLIFNANGECRIGFIVNDGGSNAQTCDAILFYCSPVTLPLSYC